MSNFDAGLGFAGASADEGFAATGRPVRHTRNDVLMAAVKILDTYGLPDLSMRRLASALDVQPSALYWHFPNKQTLLATIADFIVDRAAPVDANGLGWQEVVLAQATALRNALLAYRDGAEVVSSSLALGLGAAGARQRIASAIDLARAQNLNISDETAEATTMAILFLVLGQVWHEQQRAQADALGVVAAEATAKPADVAAGANADTQAFEAGIALITAGLSHRVAG